ncbi:MAG TPA: WYL domain-containing protein [Terracidiphilus sp.]|nr:WYL domain-containing protein [Terracidiphilus sp.]
MAIEPGPWVVTTSVESLIGAATAIRECKRVRFAYENYDGAKSRRQIEPYAVMHTDGRWYLIGYCLQRRALRTFRLDRVRDLALSTTGFRRPASFDARKYLKERMPFVQSDFQIDVWIDMPIEEAEQTFAVMRVAAEAENGGTRLRCGRDRLEMFAAMLLSMGKRMVVHHPPELKETFKRLARQAMEAAGSAEEKSQEGKRRAQRQRLL